MRFEGEWSQQKNYLDNKVTFTDKGELLDHNDMPVMMKWEAPIMKDAANLICSNGGKILNVGFGLGLIDNYIQSYDIAEHWIIEAHPDVQNKMREEGWDKKHNVKCIFDKWQNVYQDLPKFDGIYYDTWMEPQEDFHKVVPMILAPNGRYTYFEAKEKKVSKLFSKYQIEEHWTHLHEISDNQDYYKVSKVKHKHNLIINK